MVLLSAVALGLGCGEQNNVSGVGSDSVGGGAPFGDVLVDLGSAGQDALGFIPDMVMNPDASRYMDSAGSARLDAHGGVDGVLEHDALVELPDWNPILDGGGEDSSTSDAVPSHDMGEELGPDMATAPDVVDTFEDPDCPGGIGCECNDNTDCLSAVCMETADGSICVHPCVAGGGSTCVGGQDCTGMECDALLGCVVVPKPGMCSDGNACTTGDFCAGGQCQSGPLALCTDNNVCTADGCDALTGCQFTPHVSLCDDGDLCTTQDQCQNGECAGRSALDCDDENPCTDDICVKLTGCQHMPNNSPCNDGNVCTLNDTCTPGGCVGTASVVCNDNNPCTTDSCQAPTGCVFTPNKAPCNDNNGCTGNDVCSGGECLGTQNLCVTLADLWNDTAKLQEDKSLGPFGGSFAMHFISPWWDGTTLRAYYIANYVAGGIGRSATGLATSSDGVNFTNKGITMDIGGAWQWVFDAKKDLAHAIGASGANGWEASTAADAPGHMTYGPYTTVIPAGPNTASFVLQIDNNSADTKTVVTLDVFDSTDQQVLASRAVARNEFSAVFVDQIFNLKFDPKAGHSLEFRVYWHDLAWILHKTVAISQGQDPFFDNRLASFPGVWKDGNTWYLVYEGAGLSNSWPGDIGLATSTDGTTWIKAATNPILKHQTTGWEKVNIGTPSLWKKGDTWYLYYHGFDGKDVQIGVATGKDLKALVRHPQNPIIKTGGAGTWDSGTVGWRSIVQEGNYYYMVFEGSTDPPYDVAKWSSGIARSTDLLNWTKWAKNPVLTPTSQGFGQDGPSWVKTPDQKTHVYFRKPGNQTHRATLVPK